MELESYLKFLPAIALIFVCVGLYVRSFSHWDTWLLMPLRVILGLLLVLWIVMMSEVMDMLR